MSYKGQKYNLLIMKGFLLLAVNLLLSTPLLGQGFHDIDGWVDDPLNKSRSLGVDADSNSLPPTPSSGSDSAPKSKGYTGYYDIGDSTYFYNEETGEMLNVSGGSQKSKAVPKRPTSASSSLSKAYATGSRTRSSASKSDATSGKVLIRLASAEDQCVGWQHFLSDKLFDSSTACILDLEDRLELANESLISEQENLDRSLLAASKISRYARASTSVSRPALESALLSFGDKGCRCKRVKQAVDKS